MTTPNTRDIRKRLLAVKLFIMLVVVFASSFECAGEEMKVICASRTGKPPVIDGTLDDPCWQKAEVRSDFSSPGAGQSLSRKTTMRVLYDRDNLYFGFEVFWDDAELLKKGVSAIKAKYPLASEDVWLKEWKYENNYGMELFIDPGAGGRNYYQMLFNAGGQCIGNYRGILECFNIQPEVKTAVRGNCWSIELRYSAKNLKTGQEWGLNVCRNDETYYGIWKQVGGAYCNPKLFGRLVIGDYQEWWDAVGGNGAKAKMDVLKREIGRYAVIDPGLNAMVLDAECELELLREYAEKNPPTTRENFINLYERYARSHDKLERLWSYFETLQLLVKFQ